jgi:hypothetical protein
MDRALEALSSHSQKWVDLPISERIAIVERVHKAFPRVWERWTSYSVSAKGIAERKTGNDMEWLELAMITRLHTIVLTALREIKDKGNPSIPDDYRVRTNGQVAVRAFPRNRIEELAYRGVAADIWLEPEVSIDDAQSRQTWAYRQSERKGKIALVLGAGNASSLPSSDVFHKLFTDLRVVVLKMNPVNSYLGPLLEEAYRALIDRGFLRIVYGGVQEGNYLTHHDLVDEVHMTGSDRTFEAIVFGPGEEGQQRKAAGTPLLNKQVDGELGCITPWVIVPGGWKEEDVPRQAAKLAFWMMRNEGYLCFAPRLIVMHESWPLRQRFLQAVVDALAQVEPIKAYYPGSAETQRKFVEAHPEAIQIGQGIKDHVPWTVIPGLDPAATDDICFRRESFSGLCGEVALEAPSIPEFLNRAVEFLNETVWGTLSATLLVNEDTLADTEMGGAVERVISDLRYGTVALNAPGTWGIYTMVCPWGGFPGSDISDIQSGNSKVANFLMLHRPEKTVIRTPFRAWPYPFLSTAKDFHVYCRKLAAFELEPSYWKLPSLFWSAIRT